MVSTQSIDSELAKKLKELLAKKIQAMNDYRGDLSIYVAKEDIFSVAKALKEHPQLKFEQMLDLTAVDYLKSSLDYRFEVVYHFLSLTFLHRLRVKVKLSLLDVKLASISDLWLCANWYERECYDMYGIIFEGHPNLKRILMYDGFEGHPLRKDYPIDKEQPLVDLTPVKERYNYTNPILPTYE